MGSGISSPVKPDKCIEGSGEASIGVKKEDKDMKMIVELLSNPITCKHFSRFAKSLGRYNMIQCWFRLQECMEERGNLSVYRVSNLCGECYLAATSLRSMDSIDHLKSLLVGYKSQNSGADRYLESMTGKLRSVLNSLMYICLNCLVEDVYYSGYEQLVMDDDALCGDSDGSKHNASYFSYDTQYKDPNEFIFLSVLSVRETSLTFHCVKRGFSSKINASSTRQKWGSFALKVTPKASVLRKYWQDPESIVDGLTGIYKKVNHPFLSPLLESFQSPNFLFLVVPIAECGNLASSLSAQPGGTMKCSRVRFYAAEMVSALCYLHERGYCCRILKPSTVLLNSNGHIMLTDYGCIKAINDRDGNGYVNMTSDSADAYDPYIPHDIQDSMSHSVSVYGPYRVRTDSIESDTENSSLPNSKTLYDSSLRNCYSCPTSSVDFASGSVSNDDVFFMAPELLLTYVQSKKYRVQCSGGVDWYALGMTLYVLLVGKLPEQFGRTVPLDFETLLCQIPNAMNKGSIDYAFTNMFGKICVPEWLPADVINFIQSLIRFDPADRLADTLSWAGENSSGLVESVQTHAFFSEVNWSDINSLAVVPPYDPCDEMIASVRDVKTMKKQNLDSNLNSGEDKLVNGAASNVMGCAPSFLSALWSCGQFKWVEDDVNLDSLKYVDGKPFLSSADSVNNSIPRIVLNEMRRQIKIKHHDYERYYVSSDQQKHFENWNFGSLS